MKRSATRLALVLSLLVVGVTVARLFTSPDAGPPSIENYFTRTRSPHYAGIDRWAFAGMRPDAFTARLATAGYRCAALTTASDDPSGASQSTMTCTRALSWPVARTLRIDARFAVLPRLALTTVTATSTPDAGPSSAGARVAGALSHLGWIEPALLTARGFSIDSPDLLARQILGAAADPDVAQGCADTLAPPACTARLRAWSADGPMPLPSAPGALPQALHLEAMMDRLHLRPVHPRGADGLAEDALVVRVTDRRMWLDFAGRDLAGHAFTAAFELAPQGGVARRLVATAGGTTREVAVAGQPNRANAGTPMYLLPAAAAGPARMASWLVLPTPSNSASMERAAHALAASDPAFAPAAARAVVAHLYDFGDRPSQRDLNPPLQQIETLAADFRAVQLAHWPIQISPFARAAYPDTPVLRSALALAACWPEPADAPAACWFDFLHADPDAERLLRSELTERAIEYAPLPDTHPIRQHLAQLRILLPST